MKQSEMYKLQANIKMTELQSNSKKKKKICIMKIDSRMHFPEYIGQNQTNITLLLCTQLGNGAYPTRWHDFVMIPPVFVRPVNILWLSPAACEWKFILQRRGLCISPLYVSLRLDRGFRVSHMHLWKVLWWGCAAKYKTAYSHSPLSKKSSLQHTKQ